MRRLRLLLLLVAFAPALCPVIQAVELGAQSTPQLGELARARIPVALDRLEKELRQFTSSTLPPEAKTLRKTIGELRDLIDLFSYTYPSSAAVDPWFELRENLDRGYEAFGSFKDLYDSQEEDKKGKYDQDELKMKRKRCLEWQAAFLAPRELAFYRSYLSRPLSGFNYARSRKVLSKFYWGAVDITPDPSLSGIENLRALVEQLILESRKDYDDTIRIGDLTKSDHAESFHDFRKRVRSFVKILGYFPELITRPGQAKAPMAYLQDLVDRYGNINDLLVRLDRVERDGDKKEAQRVEEQIDEEWEALRDWQREIFTAGQLESLLRTLS